MNLNNALSTKRGGPNLGSCDVSENDTSYRAKWRVKTSKIDPTLDENNNTEEREFLDKMLSEPVTV